MTFTAQLDRAIGNAQKTADTLGEHRQILDVYRFNALQQTRPASDEILVDHSSKASSGITPTKTLRRRTRELERQPEKNAGMITDNCDIRVKLDARNQDGHSHNRPTLAAVACDSPPSLDPDVKHSMRSRAHNIEARSLRNARSLSSLQSELKKWRSPFLDDEREPAPPHSQRAKPEDQAEEVPPAFPPIANSSITNRLRALENRVEYNRRQMVERRKFLDEYQQMANGDAPG